MLRIYETRRLLRLTTPGRLLPWIGPALRGLTAGLLKRAVCRFSPQEQQTTRRYCKGCPHMAGCAMGRTFEADPPQAELALAGQADGVRPVTLAPAYPLTCLSREGMAVAVRAVFVGEAAAGETATIWDAVARGGAEAGLGSDGVRFRLQRGIGDGWRSIDLPARVDPGDPTVPAVRIELTSPLMLRRGATPGERRRMILAPTFADLVRAGLRTLGALGRYYGTVAEADFSGLRAAAESVPTRRMAYRIFEQGQTSRRRHRNGVLKGVVGEAEFGPVPAALLPWLEAAGRVHVGLHRVAGAGGWRVWWDGVGGDPPDWQPLE